METYHVHCPHCNATYSFVGYKTGVGKTPQQLEAMRREQTVCKYCNKPGLEADLDHETSEGQALDQASLLVAQEIASLIRPR